ncbi:MAG: hypothetical protein RLZZ346_1781 [Cyanobacteriota bacterium]|jgi:hypothetical protein
MTRMPPMQQPKPLPEWMRRAGAGMTATVAVLFVVLLVQVRLQSNRIQQLQDKVQTLENAGDLERTNALEEQLRSTVERLQGMEGLEQAVQRLSAEQANLKLQIGRGGYDNSLPPDLLRPPALPKLPSGLE